MSRLLLIHGFAGGPESWQPFLDEVRAEREAVARSAVALTLPGHRDRPPLGAGDWRSIMGALIDELPDGRFDVVGYSLGGRVALGMLDVAPARFASAVLIGAGLGLENEDERERRRARDEEWAQFLDRSSAGLDAFVERWEAQEIFASQRGLPAAILERQRRSRLDHREAGLAWSMRRLGLAAMPNLRAALTAYARADPRRVLLISGAGDQRTTASYGELAAELGVEHRTILGCGHNPVLEAPEITARAIVARLG